MQKATLPLYLKTRYAIEQILALIVLWMILPFFVSISVLIWIQMGRPIFFTQERGGYQGRVFKIIKFRTMTNDKDVDGNLLPDFERLKSVGRWIRKTSLDELPQLINIIKGDMSLIGPRPLFSRYLDRYSDEQKKRHNVRPGITGWAQVNGRNAISWDEKFELDNDYVQNVSLVMDIKIFILTIKNVLLRKDVDESQTETMTEFMGSNG